MHTDTINTTRFHYNGDASGHVIILDLSPDGRMEGVTVPFEDLLEFVGRRLRDKSVYIQETTAGKRTRTSRRTEALTGTKFLDERV